MRWLLLSLALFAAPSFAKTIVPLPPYAGAYEPQGVDERGLWMLADEHERELRDSDFVIRDAALNAYIRGVLCRAVGAERCAGVRLYVMRVPMFNASMAANGTMQVWSGFLLRVRSEAELAAVLGHEFAHFEDRHLLSDFRNERSMRDIVAWASFTGANAATFQEVATSTIYSFSRSQEKGADVHGFQYVAASPFRPGAAADVWERVMNEADATAAGRKQRSRRYAGVAFFDTHPPTVERAAYLRAMATKDGDDGIDGAAEYRAAMAPWIAGFLADQIKRNDFGGTEYLLGELAKDGWTPELLFARAELFRLRGHPRDLATAAGLYRDCIGKGSANPEARRGLGLALLRGQSPEEGKQALRDYLAMKPDAQDAAMIRMMIGQ